MPMGIVSDSDFSSELDKLNPSSRDKRDKSESVPSPVAEIVDAPHKGRGTGNVEVPDSLRRVIGEDSAINGRQSAIELAQSFGVSPSSVSAYANGSHSTSTYDDRPNASHINGSRLRVSKRAFNKLNKALHAISDDKLAVSSAKDLSSIAKDMAGVIKVMEPEDSGPKNVNNGPTFVFYSPQFRKEEHYETVVAKE